MDGINWTVIIAVIIAYIGYVYYKKRMSFTPFKVIIFPKWRLILENYSGYDEERINQLIEKYRDDNFHILKNSLIFTVLKSSEESNLIYNDNHKSFHSEVLFREVIDEIESFGYSPYFYVMEDVKGYRLGITTHESGKKSNYFGDRHDLIDIATLPYALFKMPGFRYGRMNRRRLEDSLNEYGWEFGERDTYHNIAKSPYELNHKYFTVYYEHI